MLVGFTFVSVTAGSTRLGRMVKALSILLLVAVVSVTDPSSLMVKVLVTIVLVACWVELRAKVTLPTSPSVRAVSTVVLQVVPAADPSAQLQVPPEFAALKVVFAGMVVLTTTLVEVTVAALAVFV